MLFHLVTAGEKVLLLHVENKMDYFNITAFQQVNAALTQLSCAAKRSRKYKQSPELDSALYSLISAESYEKVTKKVPLVWHAGQTGAKVIAIKPR